MRSYLHIVPRLTTFLLLVVLCSCDKDMMSSSCEATEFGPIMISGSAYIQCEMGPFYLAHYHLETCTTEFGFDSMMTENWVEGCSMSEMMLDSLEADIQVTYLEEGVLILEGLTDELNAETFELIIAGDSIDVNAFPFYGSIRYELDGLTYSYVIVNRYIGGCFHDELVWEIRD